MGENDEGVEYRSFQLWCFLYSDETKVYSVINSGIECRQYMQPDNNIVKNAIFSGALESNTDSLIHTL